jgi:L-asparaginase II
MLALCAARGWPSEGYRLADHPVQQACRDAHVEAAETEPASTATDGCGVVTFAMTLERMAHAYSRLESLDGGDRISAAMRARPDLVGGPDGADYFLMRAAPGWLAKGGAEGLICAAGPDGVGVALKSEDGFGRGHRPALAAFLGWLGVDVAELAEVPLLNSREERIGEIVAAD